MASEKTLLDARQEESQDEAAGGRDFHSILLLFLTGRHNVVGTGRAFRSLCLKAKSKQPASLKALSE